MYKVLHMENMYTNVQNFKKLNSSLFQHLKNTEST